MASHFRGATGAAPLRGTQLLRCAALASPTPRRCSGASVRSTCGGTWLIPTNPARSKERQAK